MVYPDLRIIFRKDSAATSKNVLTSAPQRGDGLLRASVTSLWHLVGRHSQPPKSFRRFMTFQVRVKQFTLATNKILLHVR